MPISGGRKSDPKRSANRRKSSGWCTSVTGRLYRFPMQRLAETPGRKPDVR